MVVSFQGDQRDEESDEVSKNINGGDSSSSINELLVEVMKQEELSMSASKRHALSERNRRKRINTHYDSLRQFFPWLVKTDKASVLSETVRRIKELKDMVAVVSSSQDDGDSSSGTRNPFFIPGENDQVSIGYCDEGEKTAVRAIICCEDRPILNRDLTDAIHSVRGKAVKAEMATVGGRTQVNVVVEWPECGGGIEDVELLRIALKAVVEDQVLGRRFVNGLSRNPNVYDETENVYEDELMAISL